MRVLFLGGGAIGDAVLPILLRDGSSKVTEVEPGGNVSKIVAREDAFDWLVSAGWRLRVPTKALHAVGDTCNVHPSLLPWGRGSNPNVWMIVDAEPSGVSVHRMTDEIDGGPIFAQREVPCFDSDTARTLYERLVESASLLFEESWPEIRDRRIIPQPQSPGGSIHTMSEFRDLININLEEEVSWKRALTVLRALTFPPFENVVLDDGVERFAVDLRIRKV